MYTRNADVYYQVHALLNVYFRIFCNLMDDFVKFVKNLFSAYFGMSKSILYSDKKFEKKNLYHILTYFLINFKYFYLKKLNLINCGQNRVLTKLIPLYQKVQ